MFDATQNGAGHSQAQAQQTYNNFSSNSSQSSSSSSQRVRKSNNRPHTHQSTPGVGNQQTTDLIHSCRDFEQSNAQFSVLEFLRIIIALSFSLLQLLIKRIFRQQADSVDYSSNGNNNNNSNNKNNKNRVGANTLFAIILAFPLINSAIELFSHYYRIVENSIFSHDRFYSLYYRLCNFPMLDTIRRFWRWRPTSVEELDRAEARILEQLKCKPKGYYVDIGKGWDLDNVRLWTLDVEAQLKGIKDENMPIVLVHGFASGVGLWCLNLDHLAQKSNRRILAFDVLGFAKSSRPNLKLPKFSGMTALQQSKAEAEKMEEFMVGSIEKWRENVGLNEKFILLGHSFGGYLSLAYAIRHPKYVGHVVLADPWGMPTDARSINNSTSHYHSSRQLPFWAKFMGKVFLDLLTPLAGLRAVGPWGPKIIGSLRPDLKQKFRRLTEPGAESVAHVDLNNLGGDDLDNEEEDVPDAVAEKRLKEENIVIDYIYHCNAQSKPSGEIAFKKMCTSTGWARQPMLERITELESSINLSFIFGSRSWIDRQSGFQAKYLLASVDSDAAYARGNEDDDGRAMEPSDEEDNQRVNVHILQGAGHHVYADKPDEFNQLVLDICADIDLANEWTPPREEKNITESNINNNAVGNTNSANNNTEQEHVSVDALNVPLPVSSTQNQSSSRRGSFRQPNANVILEEDSG